VQVRIPEPVLQNSELVSKSVCKEQGMFFWVLAVDCFFSKPQSCDENIHSELSVPLITINPSKFYVWQV